MMPTLRPGGKISLGNLKRDKGGENWVIWLGCLLEERREGTWKDVAQKKKAEKNAGVLAWKCSPCLRETKPKKVEEDQQNLGREKIVSNDD